MKKMIHTVSVEFDSAEDAYALAQIVADLGLEAQVSSRSIGNSNNQPTRETRLGSLVLGGMEEGKLYRAIDFEDLVESRGYKATSVGPILSKLAHEGDVVAVERGVYRRA